MSTFGSQAQELIAGQKYLCFYAEGATGAGGDGLFHARIFNVGSDGNTITWGDDYAVPLGSRIKTPRGTIYEITGNPFAGAKIFDCVFPHSGKLPLELDTAYRFFGVSNLKNCDILCKLGSYTNLAHPSLTSLINCIITFDFTNYSYTGASGALDFEIAFQGENAQVLCNPIYLGKDDARATPVDGSFAYFSGTG